MRLQDQSADLTQSNTASTFPAEFSTVCPTLDLPDSARLTIFPPKLKSNVSEAFAYVSVATTFDGLVKRIVRREHPQYALPKSKEGGPDRSTPSSKPSGLVNRPSTSYS